LLITPYLRMQQTLNKDEVTGIAAAAREVADNAARLGAGGEDILAAAKAFGPATDVSGARTAFGRLGDAMMRYASRHGAELGADVHVAYCPMLDKYWLQRGDAIQNPFYGRAMSDCGRIVTRIPSLP